MGKTTASVGPSSSKRGQGESADRRARAGSFWQGWRRGAQGRLAGGREDHQSRSATEAAGAGRPGPGAGAPRPEGIGWGGVCSMTWSRRHRRPILTLPSDNPSEVEQDNVVCKPRTRIAQSGCARRPRCAGLAARRQTHRLSASQQQGRGEPGGPGRDAATAWRSRPNADRVEQASAGSGSRSCYGTMRTPVRIFSSSTPTSHTRLRGWSRVPPPRPGCRHPGGAGSAAEEAIRS